MAQKTMEVTLRIKVRELDQDEQRADGCEPFDDGEELEATTPHDCADIVRGMFYPDAVREAFAGSNMYVTFDGRPKIVSADWVHE